MSKEANESILSDELLSRCMERAPVYDREDRFFTEDFDELKGAGYMLIALPKVMGGRGMSLAEVGREQRRLAYYAAPTTLALNMHNYWVGLITDLWNRGDTSLEWLLKEVANGAILAAGHAESGNDVPVLNSTTKAERVEGGYRFTGRKSFGSLTPVWDYLGLHGLDTSNPNEPKIVHAFMSRDTEGYSIKSTWNGVMGMRATQSDDTILEGAFVPDKHIARVVPVGFSGIDEFVIGMFAWALLGFGNVYCAMAQRVLDMTVEYLKEKKSISLSRGNMVHHAGIQQDIAEMTIELEGIAPHLDKVAEDWSNGVDHGPLWGAKITAAKYHAVESAWKVIDKSLDVVGGYAIFPHSGFERLFRDARLGRLHPANSYLTHEIVAKTALGLNPDDQPRWG